ncbi:MAG TPA: DUF4199 domain-containing protein [Candidatus Coprenecus pullistercoris]|nr:DUF4199 domain-containing protein [Candidatus Coprenecus pullistercoris]
MNYKLNWSEAAKYGLILSSVSVIINMATSIWQMPALANVLLNVIKLCLSVYILYYAIRRNADSWENISYGQSFGFGMATCTFSAIVCTLFVLLTYTVILPDAMAGLLDQVFSMYESMGVPAAIDYDTMLRAMPFAITVSQFINCIFCGLIVSAILASFARKNDSNPFKTEETEQ